MARGVCSLIIALLFCVLWHIVFGARRYYAQLDNTSATAIRQRLLKPRTPDDCPCDDYRHRLGVCYAR